MTTIKASEAQTSSSPAPVDQPRPASPVGKEAAVYDEELQKPAAVDQNLDDDPVYSYAEQRKIVRKVDRRLVLLLGVMYCVSLMDRNNLPNAAIAGMNEDLGLDVGFRYVRLSLVSDMQEALAAQSRVWSWMCAWLMSRSRPLVDSGSRLLHHVHAFPASSDHLDACHRPKGVPCRALFRVGGGDGECAQL